MASLSRVIPYGADRVLILFDIGDRAYQATLARRTVGGKTASWIPSLHRVQGERYTSIATSSKQWPKVSGALWALVRETQKSGGLKGFPCAPAA